jgi:hypothetical protein
MATIGASFFDLIDLYKSQDGQGNVADVIEMLAEMNPILDDAITVECNKGSTHLHGVRTGLPSVAWGQLYAGVNQSKSTRAQVEDTTGFVEGLSSVDKRILELSGNPGAVRLSEAEAYLEAMNQEVAAKIFYGNSASDPKEFMGLAPRFNDLGAANGGQIIDAAGTGSDNTSVWFVTWGENQTHLLYPKGTQAGIKREDKGEQRVADADGNPYYVKEELFTWHVGLAVKDWRYVTRIANIDVSALVADPTAIDGSTLSIYDVFRKAYWQHQGRRTGTSSGGRGRTAIYANKDVLEALDAASVNSGTNDSFVRLTTKEIEGKEVLTYRGMPLRESDSLLNTEARVT